MKKAYLIFSLLFGAYHLSIAQTIFWTENFNNGCTANCPADGYAGTNGVWTVADIGVQGNVANQFFISCAENGEPVGQCGAGCGNNATLHVGSVPCQFCFFCPNGDCGAAYNAGPAIFGEDPTTDKRCVSPMISTVGYSAITLSGKYMEQGQGTLDNADFEYSTDGGTTWTTIIIAKSNNANCSPQGEWTAFSYLLPATCNNILTFKLALRWANNDDGVGTDPSFAIDDIELSVQVQTAPIAGLSTPIQSFCDSTCISFTDNSTGAPTSYLWTFTGAVPATSTLQNPTNICYNLPGVYDVQLIVTNAVGSDTLLLPSYITVNPCFAPVVNIAATDTFLCEKSCIDFFDLSTNSPTSWQWTFTGASPPSSTLQNPTNVCFNLYGTYDVTLVASNASGTGNTTFTQFITVFENPAAPSVTQVGNTLFSSPAMNYQWYLNSNIIPNAVQQVYIATQAGNYYVVITDSNGCQAASNQVTVTSMMDLPGKDLYLLSPNPVHNLLTITLYHALADKAMLEIYDVHGRMVSSMAFANDQNSMVVDASKLNSGIYFVRVLTKAGIFTQKFSKH
ncbi:MAG: T9SS type A sorting domain-containing protein [Bacteroidetes bacterium]|nr:T9SS type A sorting domain-containing protein [Bacteroidota bacterium]